MQLTLIKYELLMLENWKWRKNFVCILGVKVLCRKLYMYWHLTVVYALSIIRRRRTKDTTINNFRCVWPRATYLTPGHCPCLCEWVNIDHVTSWLQAVVTSSSLSAASLPCVSCSYIVVAHFPPLKVTGWLRFVAFSHKF